MNGNISPYKRPAKEGDDPVIALEDLHDVQQNTLSNIGDEIERISGLIEKSMTELSGEFMNLVKYSKQQVDDMTLACDLLQGSSNVKGLTPTDEIHDILRDSAEASGLFSSNVNQIIYTMQFQDHSRQLMGAISAALDILARLSSSSTNTNPKPPLSEDSRKLLSQLIKEAAHKDLDQNYILRLFLGAVDQQNTKEDEATDDCTDIEFF